VEKVKAATCSTSATSSIVVVRLNGLDLERYWLVGDINLARTQLSKEGANKYRARNDLQ
jgi:hypothetical protein